MKKIIIVATALLFTIGASAQHFGVTAGLTSTKTDIKSAIADTKNINQYHVGILYQLKLGNILAIQPALIYNVKGATINEIAGQDLAEIGGSIDFKTSFLELPIQVQAGFPILGIGRVYALGEPFIGYALANKATMDVEKLGSVNKNSWDNVKNRFEYGIGVGIGAELFKHLQVSVKYFWNLGNLYGENGKVDDDILHTVGAAIGESKCNGIAASVAFLF